MGFDFFAQPELPAPALPTSEVAALCEAEFGLSGELIELGSQQDQNFLLRTEQDAVVIKLVNPAFGADEVEAQDAAASLIAERTGLRVARPRASAVVESSAGRLQLRVIDYVAGGTLSGSDYLSTEQIAGLGQLAATVSLALAEFEHPGLDRTLQWNLTVAERVVDQLAVHLSAERRERVLEATRIAAKALAARADELPWQAGHFDLTDDNVVRGPAGIPDGVIDFGDVSRSWAVAELAVAVSSILHHADAEPWTVLPAVIAFDSLRPLGEAELAALWPLVVLRTAVLVVSGAQQVVLDADNSYAAGAMDREWRMFEQASSIPHEVMTGAIRNALGRVPLALADRETALFGPLMQLNSAREFSFDVWAPDADGGVWQSPGAAERAARTAATFGPVVRRAAVAQLNHSRPRSRQSAASIPTWLTVWGAAGRELCAPLDGTLKLARGSEGAQALWLELSDGSHLELNGVEAMGVDAALSANAAVAVARGDLIGVAGDELRIRWRAGSLEPSFGEIPDWVRPEVAAGWLAVLLDAAPLIGLPPSRADGEAAEAVLARRAAHFAEVQEHYFEHPPQIERGWMNHLLDTNGLVYLDMVNNVTSIGHGHLGLASAVSEQLRRLNTNSRFHYQAVAEFSEALAATLPDPLDTVFLVNSGSEAVDLAIRIAMAATDRRDIVSVLEAYHGWTYASDAVSTSIADNPRALETRPDWVHPVTAPNTFRGPYPDAPERYAADAVAEIRRLAEHGNAPAGFLVESWYGNAGGVQLPDGYLQTVYSAVRELGGLAIADEVQVGYGRLGDWFWGFEQQQVVPDIVAVAKSMGNGYPLGAVITSREIAARYRAGGYFFSSTGGSPVSSVVGLTVLREIQGSLQNNAATTGETLRARLNTLAERTPQIGAVHGHGFYLGLELVRDETLTPATAETKLICNRLRENGIIMQPTGDHQNVLKIKPPLVTTREDVDFFVDTLEHVLSTTRWDDWQ